MTILQSLRLLTRSQPQKLWYLSSANMSSGSPIKIENLLVLGSGLMGAGIAQVSAASGKFKTVVLQDISQPQLDKAKSSIHQSLLRIKKKNPSLDDAKIMANITFSTEVQEKDVGSGLLVIEAVPEKLDLKQDIFKNL